MYVHFFPPLLSFPRSRADIFECFSLTRQPFYLSLSSRRLEVIGSRKELGARGRHPLPSRVSLARPVLSCAQLLPSACYVRRLLLSKGNVTRDDSQRQLLAQHCVAMLQRFETTSQQCCNAVLRSKSSLRIVPCNITVRAWKRLEKDGLKNQQGQVL